MLLDKFGRSPKTGQNVTNVSEVSHEYVNSNFLRKGYINTTAQETKVQINKMGHFV